MKVAPEQLNAVMEFGRVIQVLESGDVTYRSDIYAPDLFDGELGAAGWSLLNGWSGQDRYSGPIMHASEFIGGGMARWILETPGIYVALVDYPSDGDDPDGWAVATLELESDESETDYFRRILREESERQNGAKQ